MKIYKKNIEISTFDHLNYTIDQYMLVSNRYGRIHQKDSGEQKHMLEGSLTLCIREAPKWVLLQTVKTEMKCSIMLHLIRVYTVCKGKKDLQTKEYNIFLKF